MKREALHKLSDNDSSVFKDDAAFKYANDEDAIIGIWDIEVFFKVCKSYLNLSRECNSLSYDAMTAHTAVVFTRYMMLSVENRETNDSNVRYHIEELAEAFMDTLPTLLKSKLQAA